MKKPIEIEDIKTYTFYGNLRTSLHGAVFTAAKAEEKENRYRYWLQMLKDGAIQDLTTFGAENAFFLDDSTVYFCSNRNEEKDRISLYTISLHGGEAQKLAEFSCSNAAILDKSGHFLLLSIPEDGQEQETDYEVLDEIPFYFNNAGFINKKRTRLFLYDLQENHLHRITPEDMDVQSACVYENSLYICAQTVVRRRDKPTSGIWKYDLKTEKMENILPEHLLAIMDLKVLKGTLLLMASDMKRYGLNENPCLYTLQAGRPVKLLDLDLAFSNTTGTDCRLLGTDSSLVHQDVYYFLATAEENVWLYAYNLKEIRPFLKWKGSIDSFAFEGEDLLFIGAKPAELQQLYQYNKYGEKQLSDFNPQMKEYSVSLPQPLTYQGYDGKMLQGWVLYPRNFQPDQSYPGILDIHGGPKTVYSTIFYHEMQVWAARGFFVFFCNPHGSDGFGNVYADIRGKYGTIDYTDLMAFTDAVLEAIPQIDPKRIGVTGGSYGGFMTNWIIGHTGRFAAAASQRSISNWLSFYGTSDIGVLFVKDQQSAGLENPATLWDHSPLKYASNVKTPTLFIHSDEDYRCPLEQGLQMLSVLLEQNVDSRMCLFHKENHELSRSGKPDHRVRRLKEITEWMESYLKP